MAGAAKKQRSKIKVGIHTGVTKDSVRKQQWYIKKKKIFGTGKGTPRGQY